MNIFCRKVKRNQIYILIIGLCWVLLTWCGGTWNNDWTISSSRFSVEYNPKLKLEKIELNDEDLWEISALYQEAWNGNDYKDSLLIAEKYSQWLGINTFAQENLDSLEQQWLSLDNIKKTQIWIKNKEWKINWVLVEYEITKWLISELPKLYVSQLFIPNDENVILFSFITEKSSSRSLASDMFKKVK